MSILQWVVEKRDGVCLWGLFKKDGCSGPLDPHHIVFRSAGGKDAKENLITLCRKHHDQAQRHLVSKEDLFDVLRKFYGYGGNDVEGTDQ
jgi:5-methylcytosine-specific restriction endonuclease McrA